MLQTIKAKNLVAEMNHKNKCCKSMKVGKWGTSKRASCEFFQGTPVIISQVLGEGVIVVSVNKCEECLGQDKHKTAVSKSTEK